MEKDQLGDEDDPPGQEARRGAWPAWHHVLPGPLPVWISLCLSRFPMLLKIRPQISQGWMYLKADTGSGQHTALADRHRVHLHKCLSQQVG